MMRAYTSYAAPTPLQAGVAKALDALHNPDTTAESSEASTTTGTDLAAAAVPSPTGLLFHANFDRLAATLTAAGAVVYPSGGGYFLVADVAASGLDAMAFCRRLAEQHAVAAVPLSVFCHESTPETRSLVRFAICKRESTMAEACLRLTPDIMAPAH